jgi:formyl-CoA transferase
MPALDGMRILDLTQYEAGPSFTQMLAWLGADVVKVEQPGVGDPGRHTERGTGDSLYFLSHNANKRSVTIDLRSDEGRRLFLRLVQRFDAVVENFTLGTIEKLGLGYDVLRAANPRIIYATAKGFGTSGPYAGFKCYEMVAQAASGVYALTGDPNGVPYRSGANVGDTGSGLTLALQILAAYIQRGRTGRGQMVEVAMQEAAANFTRTSLSFRERAGDPVPRRGNRSTVPTDLYPCAPGGLNDYAYIMISTSRQYDALCTAIDRPDLAIDERFATTRAREVNGDALFEEIAAWTRRRTKYEVMRYLGSRGVPCSALLDSHDLWRDEHLRARGAVTRINHPTRGEQDMLAPPFRMEDSHVAMAPAPLLGEHTDEVLAAELGLDQSELARLAEAGVTAKPFVLSR